MTVNKIMCSYFLVYNIFIFYKNIIDFTNICKDKY